jgi:hypothetical protein
MADLATGSSTDTGWSSHSDSLRVVSTSGGGEGSGVSRGDSRQRTLETLRDKLAKDSEQGLELWLKAEEFKAEAKKGGFE